MTISENLDFSISSLDNEIFEKWSKRPLCIKTLWNSASNELLFGRITPNLVPQKCIATGANINDRTVIWKEKSFSGFFSDYKFVKNKTGFLTLVIITLATVHAEKHGWHFTGIS